MVLFQNREDKNGGRWVGEIVCGPQIQKSLKTLIKLNN